MASIVKEGRAEIFLEKFEEYRGPGKRTAGFYNPAFSMDRDLQIIFLACMVREGVRRILDSMAATGVRGIRMAKEVEGELEVDINDSSRAAVKIIEKNVERNGVDVKVFNKNVCSLLEERKYDYIDLDPYGSPAPFIPCLFSGMKKRCYVSISATDTATLCGAHRKKCLRRYGAIPVRGHGVKEAGVRILLGFIAREAASHDYGFVPLISYSRSHYFRVYGMMEKGAKRADECLKNMGWLYWDDGWNVSPLEYPVRNAHGPMWIGEIHSVKLIRRMTEEMKSRVLEHEYEIRKLFTYFEKEADMPPLYYETGNIASDFKAGQPRINVLLHKLRENGYRAERCHFSPDAIKTDAPYSIIGKFFV